MKCENSPGDGGSEKEEDKSGGGNTSNPLTPLTCDKTAPPNKHGGDDWGDNLRGLRELTESPKKQSVKKTSSGHPTEDPTARESSPKGATEHAYKGPVDPLDVGERAKAYVKEQKDKIIEELKKSLGENLLTHEAVKTANNRRLSAPNLQSGETSVEYKSLSDGDFFSTGDGRVLRMHLETNLPCKTNTSFSFNPVTMVCSNCPGAVNHPVMGAHARDCSYSPVREVIVLSDCSYLHILPCATTNKCLRIIRLEQGSIAELTSTLLERLSGRQLCLGSIVMVFSAVHLALIGLTAYIEDLVCARKRLLANLGPNIYITAAPLLLLSGSSNC